MKTTIINIEGIDGSGKTVQFNRLCDYLRESGYTVDTRAFPVYESFFGAQIGRFLSNAEGVAATDIDQKSMSLWFALDRFEALKNWRDGEYDFLIINRYVLSNAVYQSIRDRDMDKPDIMDWVFDLEYNHFSLPRPALNIVFNISTEQAGHNVDSKGVRNYIGEGRDVYEGSLSIQERARNMYILAAQRYDDVEIINCMDGSRMRTPEDIGREVEELLKKRGFIK